MNDKKRGLAALGLSLLERAFKNVADVQVIVVERKTGVIVYEHALKGN